VRALTTQHIARGDALVERVIVRDFVRIERRRPITVGDAVDDDESEREFRIAPGCDIYGSLAIIRDAELPA
jgi:hypothetical protein